MGETDPMESLLRLREMLEEGKVEVVDQEESKEDSREGFGFLGGGWVRANMGSPLASTR